MQLKLAVVGLVLFFFAIGPHAQAQRRRMEDGAVWYSQSLSVPLGEKWSFTEDASLRWYGLHRNVSFVVLRGCFERKLGKSWWLGAGYAFFEQFKDREGWFESRKEQRPHLQLTGRKKWISWQWTNRWRIEERFFNEKTAGGERFHSYFTRLRYMTALQWNPFKREGWSRWYGIAQTEIMFHAGEPRYVRQAFDQWRLYPHIGFKWYHWLELQAGYMWVYQINPANTQETVAHVLRCSALFRLSPGEQKK